MTTKHHRETALNLERIYDAWVAGKFSIYQRLGKRLRWRELFLFLRVFMTEEEAKITADKIKESKPIKMKTNDIKEQEALDNNQYLRDKAMEAHREFKQACLEGARGGR